jgi:hypothetical protein
MAETMRQEQAEQGTGGEGTALPEVLPSAWPPASPEVPAPSCG